MPLVILSETDTRRS